MVDSGNADGFTLIEVLVSFAILSITVIVGFQIYSENLARIAKIETAMETASAAKRSLSLVGDVEAPPDLRKTRLTETLPDWTSTRPILYRVAPAGQNLVYETVRVDRGWAE
jgi:prepilin-type N-terminal cleavage/methylation domain-containing protein